MSAKDQEAEAGWFKQLFESSPDPTWIIDGRQFVECNDAAVATLGYASREALKNVHPSKLSPPTQPDGEDSFSKAERMMATAFDKGLHRFDWVHTRADGTNFDAEVTLSRIDLLGRSIIYCVWRDITERKRSERALRESESRFRALFEQAAVGVAQVDTTTRRCVEVNAKYCEIVGYSKTEIKAVDTASITHPDDIAVDVAAIERLKAGLVSEINLEKRFVRKDGHPVWVSVTASPLWVRGEPPNRHMEIVTDISRRKEAEQKLLTMAHTDALTGLANRGHFLALAKLELSRSIRYGNPLSVLMLDADMFKTVNDRYGHAVGDKALQKLAQVCRDTLREVDIIGRLGGEEFAVLLPETDRSMAVEVAERVRRAVADSRVPMESGLPLKLTVSIGVSSLTSREDNLDVLLNLADSALYEAKHAGRNRVSAASD